MFRLASLLLLIFFSQHEHVSTSQGTGDNSQSGKELHPFPQRRSSRVTSESVCSRIALAEGEGRLQEGYTQLYMSLLYIFGCLCLTFVHIQAVDSLQQELPPGRRTRNAQRTDTYKDESSSSSEESEHARGRSFRRSSSRPFASLAGAEPAQTRPRPRQTEVLSSSLMEARGGDASRPRRSGRQQTFVEDDQEVEPDQGSRRSLRHSADKAQSRGGDGGGSRVLRLQPGSKDGDQNESSGSESSEESESEEEEEEEGKKYSLRDRGGLKRETMNIQQLGGDGGAYKRSAGRQSRQDDRISYKDPQARIRLGGRISPPHYKRGSKRRRSGRGHRDRDRDGSGRRHFDSSSESSSGSEAGGWRGRSSLFSRDRKDQRGGAVSSGGGWGGFGGEEDQFSQHERHRQQRELDSIQPLMGGPPGMGMGGSVVDSTSRRDVAKADATPIGVDPSIGFHSVGGLDNHIRALKEMVVLPLLYPDVFARFDTQPPRGVLFVGPPGTGKTLTARALVNSLSVGTVAPAPDGKPTVVNWSNGKKVSFFMRKGADCLSKWVGEGERQLRLLFEQAKRFQPSIIFFDEIDGLAPVRSAKQDQIHASIVSTLLALMDGLDSRGQIVIIGATNRPDAVDPALRRPGRFDRELMFPLPDASARAAILDIHTGI